MSKNKKILPELRFPEFDKDGEWRNILLGKFIKERNEISNGEYSLFSLTIENGITPKTGRYERAFLVKDEKDAYKLAHPNDFAFNPMNLRFGAIAQYKGQIIIALSKYYNIFHCDESVDSRFCEFYFKSNQMLTIYDDIATGSLIEKRRVHFSAFLKLKIPFPFRQEQQKIASCLSSLDELLAAHTEKLEALKNHKKGLMQNLFPQEGEKAPKYRFKEFENDGEWVEKTIGSIAKVTAGGTPSSTEVKYWGGDIPWMNSGDLNLKRVYSVSNRITKLGLKESSTKKIPPLCILIGLAGQGKTRGTAAINYIELCTNQSIASIHPNSEEFLSEFLYQLIDSKYLELRSLSKGEGGRGGLNLQIIKSIEILLPSIKEQQKIASNLSALDELITAQSEKIEQLQLHKKGLMQGLLPKIAE